MTPEEMFPDGHREGQDRRIAAAWDLSWPLPVPRFELTCPHCRGQLVLKGWRFHIRSGTGTNHPWRCDVRLKCMGCGYVPIFGVVIPRAMHATAGRLNRKSTSSWIEWRQGQQILRDAGFFETCEGVA